MYARFRCAMVSVDIVVSFETIEHVYQHDAFIAEVRRVLRPNGALIISTPDRDIYSPSDSAANPFHVRELTKEEFTTTLRRAFQHVECLSQRTMIGSAMLPDQLAAGVRAPITFERRGEDRFPKHPRACARGLCCRFGLGPGDRIAARHLVHREQRSGGRTKRSCTQRGSRRSKDGFNASNSSVNWRICKPSIRARLPATSYYAPKRADLSAQLADLQTENAARGRQLTDLQAGNQSLAARGEALRTDKATLQRQLADLRSTNQTLFSTDQSLRMENAALTERAAQFKDVQSMLLEETHHLWGSSSWRLFRPLRNVSRRLGGHRREFEPSPTSAAEALQTVITIRQSLSWELTAPLRVVHRILSRFRPWDVDGGRSSGESPTGGPASEPGAISKSLAAVGIRL